MHDNSVKTLKFSPSSDDLLLISGDLNGNIISCQYFNKDFILKKTIGHEFGVNSIDFLDDTNFVTCGNDNNIKIWNIKMYSCFYIRYWNRINYMHY